MRYAIVIEKADDNYSAYVPDVPGCIATGATIDEVKKNLAGALQFHLEGMRADGDAVPTPSSTVDYLDVQVPAKRAAG
jgi:predicted RNase H-like HicB family nuclease